MMTILNEVYSEYTRKLALFMLKIWPLTVVFFIFCFRLAQLKDTCPLIITFSAPSQCFCLPCMVVKRFQLDINGFQQGVVIVR